MVNRLKQILARTRSRIPDIVPAARRVPRRLLAAVRGHTDVIIVLVVIFGLYGTNAVREDRTEAVQRREGLMIERKLCTTLHTLASRKPPAGGAAENPSRAYEQWLHGQLSQLGPDMGCR
jgi:hypothetical protein